MGLVHGPPILEGKYKLHAFMWMFINSLNSLYNSFEKANKVLLFKQFEMNSWLSKISDSVNLKAHSQVWENFWELKSL